MFCQITADEERHVSQHIVVMQHPSLIFPQFRPLPAHSIPQNVLKLPGTTVYHLTMWYKFMMDNAFPIKKQLTTS